MADKFLSSVSGGGDFIPSEIFGGLTHSLSSATPLTITPSSGKRLRIDFLASSGAVINNVSVSTANRTIVDNGSLHNSSSLVGFFINNSPYGRSPILFFTGESVEISTSEAGAANVTLAVSEGF